MKFQPFKAGTQQSITCYCGNKQCKNTVKKKSILNEVSIIHEVLNLENAIAYISSGVPLFMEVLLDGRFSSKITNHNVTGAKLKKKNCFY